MVDFAPKVAVGGIQEQLGYNVLVSTFENGVEQRRLKSSQPIIGFKIQSPPLTPGEYSTLRTFYKGKYGPLTAFTFTSPLDAETYTVRFGTEPFGTQDRAGGLYFGVDYSLVVVI